MNEEMKLPFFYISTLNEKDYEDHARGEDEVFMKLSNKAGK